MSPLAVQRPPDLFHGVGEDGVEYAVRPFRWSYELVERYLQEFVRFHIFTDDVPATPEAFIQTMGGATIWFEMVKVGTEENVGFMYLTDFIPSMTEKRFISATFHAVTWDAKAAPRRQLALRFIRQMFKEFRLHRLQAAVPLNRGGAIRTLKRLGFKDEGVVREAVRYGGRWYGVLLLSILEHEVTDGHVSPET